MWTSFAELSCKHNADFAAYTKVVRRTYGLHPWRKKFVDLQTAVVEAAGPLTLGPCRVQQR